MVANSSSSVVKVELQSVEGRLIQLMNIAYPASSQRALDFISKLQELTLSRPHSKAIGFELYRDEKYIRSVWVRPEDYREFLGQLTPYLGKVLEHEKLEDHAHKILSWDFD